MIKRTAAAFVVAAGALGIMAPTAGAAPGGQSKNTFLAQCTGGTLAGETIVVPGGSGNSVFLDDGTHLRVTRIRGVFDGQSFEQFYGSKQGTHTCIGSISDEEGTFTFDVTLAEVPPRRS